MFKLTVIIAVILSLSFHEANCKKIIYEPAPELAELLIKNFEEKYGEQQFVRWSISNTDSGLFSRFYWLRIDDDGPVQVEHVTNRYIKIQDKLYPLFMPGDGHYWRLDDFKIGRKRILLLFYDGLYVYYNHSTGEFYIK